MGQTYLVRNIGQLVTLAPIAKHHKLTGFVEDDLGCIADAYLLLDDQGKVVTFGSEQQLPKDLETTTHQFDAQGGLILPGFVDSHTHIIYGGNRSHEFVKRLQGATYQEIAAAGGGIASTMHATRKSADDTLVATALQRLDHLLSLGTTTVETKSGYGLSVQEELRLLRLLQKVAERSSQHVEVTCLALHDRSPEHASTVEYAQACLKELLPIVVKEGLAQWVDAFVEQGYFSVKDVQEFFVEAKNEGLGIRLHADEFAQSGAALAAAQWGAASADHLQFASEAGIDAMATNGVVATILPGTSLYTKIPFTDATRFIKRGVPVAVASDLNPGSCQIGSLAMLATVACLQGNLPPTYALPAITYIAAYSLRLQQRKGSLAEGADGDFVWYRHMQHWQEWLADYGKQLPDQVWLSGSTLRSK